MKMKTGIFLILLSFITSARAGSMEQLPLALRPFLTSAKVSNIGGHEPSISFEALNDSVYRCLVSVTLSDAVQQDDWQLNFTPAFKPTFHWAPHLTPTAKHIIAQHVFRAPALIVAGEGKQVSIIPDLDVLAKQPSADWYMDLDAQEALLTLGMSKSIVSDHVLYERSPGAHYAPGKQVFACYILLGKESFNPWRAINAFHWRKWGSVLYDAGEPLQHKKLAPYVKHTYDWAFKHWKLQVWQSFELNGKEVGAPVFIVNTTQSPNYPGEVNEREFRSIWNQAWFNSLRSAQGLYRYAKRNQQQDLLAYALKTKELALQFPQKKGLFPGLIATEMEMKEMEGKAYNRSKGWETYYFGNSNRNPYAGDPKRAPLHILDMSYTAWLMLTWYDELEKDARLLTYAENYAEGLLGLQDAQGFFPAWLDPSTLAPLEALKQSPETAMSVTFLLKLYELTNKKPYQEAAIKALDALINEVVPAGRWEDFETYWSCSRYGADDLLGKRIARNDMYKQNTLSMYWTAQALLEGYQLTKQQRYLDYGKRTLDELLMAQAVWQPPYIYVAALGGFGVMNADGEWNDSRQSLFAELILAYGKLLQSKEYTQRGLAALRASFVMMYCPENPKTAKQWQQVWPFFGQADYGFMMENYGHTGVTSPQGIGIGEFTIYDWGNGAAAEAYNRIVDHYGEAFLLEN